MASNHNPYWLVTDAVTYDDDDATTTVGEIPAGTLVMCSCIVVSTALTDDSTSIEMGDEDNQDCFVDTGDATATTAGAYFGDGGDASAFEGAWYPAAKRVTITIAGGTLTAGSAFGVIQCLDLSHKV